MAPSPATLSSAYREAYSLDRALGRLFGGILTHLQRKQWFSDSATSPSLFVVYAHDKKEEAAANPNVAVAIINWLRKIQARAYSDLYPLSNTLCEERENGTESVANILSNQFCILPGTSKYGVVNSVDKVIVCGSELLKKYVEDKFSGPYIETIRETYERARYQDPNERQNEIRTVVESHCRKEAFHHVLTELAFIKLRYFHDSNGKSIIPVVLSGNPVPSTGCGMEYLPFLDGTDLRLKLQPAAPLADQHKLFFKLLMQISPDLTPFIQLIQDGYEDAHKELSQTTTLTERNVSEVLTSFFEKFADSMSSLIPPPMKYLERWRLTPSYGAEEIALGSTNASFLEDWQFQNRESTLKELSQLVAEKKSSGTLTILLSGPLGIGKKATVAHFLSTLLSRSRTFFVDSEDERALQTRYGEIAETLFLAPTRESGMQPYTSGQSKSVTIRNVRNSLSTSPDPWAMIFDGYNGSFEIKQYFPDNPNGLIFLCVINASPIANNLGIPKNRTIDLNEMNEDHLSALFWMAVTNELDYKPEEDEKIQLKILLDRVGCHTLSIKIAANFFANHYYGTASSESIRSFIEAMNQEARPYDGMIYENLTTPWQIVITRLLSKSPDKVATLDYLQFRVSYSYHCLPISKLVENIFEVHNSPEWTPHGLKPRFLQQKDKNKIIEQYKTAERLLSNYGLLAIGPPKKKQGEIHLESSLPKVFHHFAPAILRRLRLPGVEDSNLSLVALCTLGESVPWSFKHEDVAYRQQIIHHIDACLQADLDRSLTLLDTLNVKTAGAVLLGFAICYTEAGRFKDAGILQTEALEKLEQGLGPNADLTLKAKSQLAATREVENQYPAALELRRSVHKQRKLEYEANPGDSLIVRNYTIAMADLALSCFGDPCQKQQALQYRREVLRHCEIALEAPGLSEQKTSRKLALLKAKREVAISCHALDLRIEARKLREQVVEELGEEASVFALNALRELLISLTDARQFNRAETLGQKLITMSSELLTEHHPDTELAKSTHAALLRVMDRSGEAIPIQKRALEILEGSYEKNASPVISAKYDLAHSYLASRDITSQNDAFILFREIEDEFKSSTRETPRDYYQLLIVRKAMAIASKQRSRLLRNNHNGLESAITKLRRVLEDFSETPYPRHDSTIISARLSLGDCLDDNNDLEKAAEEYKKILAILDEEAIEGTDNGFKAKLRLASVYERLADPPEQQDDLPEYYERVEQSAEHRLHSQGTRRHPPSEISETPMSIRSVLVHMACHCFTSRRTAMLETRCNSPSDEVIYDECSGQQLQQRALQLREDVVRAIFTSDLADNNTQNVSKSERENVVQGVPGIERYVVTHRLGAEACRDLAKSRSWQRQYDDACALQRAAVSFYMEYWGPGHRETMKNEAILRGYTFFTDSRMESLLTRPSDRAIQ